MKFCYITDRRQFPGTEADQRRALLGKVAEASAAGVDFIQLRERELAAHELERLGRDAMAALRSAGTTTRLLINSRLDLTLALNADGVHLRSNDIAASDARAVSANRSPFTVAVSCHTTDEVRAAWSHGADFAVFAPVFEKEGRSGVGLKGLREACSAVPDFVFALGGVTVENARDCIAAGAVGLAGIRLYQECDISTLVAELRKTKAVGSKSG